MISAPAEAGRRGIRLWLMVIFALVAVMIAIGGLTRLTESGLSITEWNPVTGALPPLNDADWQVEFQKYQASPQGQIVNATMTIDGVQGDLLVGMGAPAVGPGDRAGLGRWIWPFHPEAAGAGGMGAAAVGAGGVDRTSGPDRLADGRLGAGGDDDAGRVMVAGAASGRGLCDSRLHRVVGVPAGAVGDGPAAARGAMASGGWWGCRPGSCICCSCRSCWGRWWRGSTRGGVIRPGRT